jgi:hypothetical protein
MKEAERGSIRYLLIVDLVAGRPRSYCSAAATCNAHNPRQPRAVHPAELVDRRVRIQPARAVGRHVAQPLWHGMVSAVPLHQCRGLIAASPVAAVAAIAPRVR